MHDSYEILSSWGARVEAPEELAARFIKTIDALALVQPSFNDCEWIDAIVVRGPEPEAAAVPWQRARRDLARAIVRNMKSEDDGIPDPYCGYWLPAMANRHAADRFMSLAVSASKGERGGSPLFPFMNRADLESKPELDPSLRTFDVWRAMLLIIAETWEVTWAETTAPSLLNLKSGYPVRPAWMSYVSPHYAPLMTPPASAIVEHRPNGGLFLAATRDVFETANPTHLAVAREIEAALQPLNHVPNPNDAPYL